MSAADYLIYAFDSDSVYVVADMLAYGLCWPTTIKHKGVTYKFAHNEVMQDWMVGNYSGHAKYTATR